MSNQIQIRLAISGFDLTQAELADLGQNLYEELLVLDVEDARPAGVEPPPPGAKAGEGIALGGLLVTAAPALIGRIFDVVTSWLKRQDIDVEVDFNGMKLKGSITRHQRDELVAAFLAQATGRTDQP
jgi:hypothetical protein